MKRFVFKTIAMAAAMLLAGYTWLVAQEVRIHQLDIGTGSSNYIEVFESGTIKANMLIDAGSRNRAKKIRDYLHKNYTHPPYSCLNIQHLVVTHYDEDHLGGAVGTASSTGLLDEPCNQDNVSPVAVNNIYHRGGSINPPVNTDVYNEYTSIVRNIGYSPVIPAINSEYTLWSNSNYTVNYTFLSVNGRTPDYDSKTDDENELSLVMLLQLKQKLTGKVLFSYLVAGDLPNNVTPSKKRKRGALPGVVGCGISEIETNTVLGNRIKNRVGSHVCVATVSHHGANNGFYRVATNSKPVSVFLISSGSQYSHPHQNGLQVAAALSDRVYVTDRNRQTRYGSNTADNGNTITFGSTKVSFKKATADPAPDQHIVVSFSINGGSYQRKIWRADANGNKVTNGVIGGTEDTFNCAH